MNIRIEPTRSTIYTFLLITCLWIAMELFVNPVGNFPLNDDWVYGKAVYHLVEKGEFHFIGWTDTTLIAQVFWGALFCLPFGFSFTALRISTLTIGLIGIFATNSLLKEAGAKPSTALLGSLIIATNPLYFELSNTFMTDVPFFGVTMLAFLFLVRGMRHENILELTGGLFLACTATLIRQFGLMIPLAFGVAYLTKHGINRKSLYMAVFPTIIVFGILLMYQFWVQPMFGLPSMSRVIYRRYPSITLIFLYHIVEVFLLRGVVSGMYIGLFLLPFLAWIIPGEWRTMSFRSKILSSTAVIVGFVCIFGRLVWIGQLMPFCFNVLFDFGLGPVVLHDVYILELPNLPKAPRMLWLFVTAGSVLGMMFLLYYGCLCLIRFCSKVRKSHAFDDEWLSILFISACLFYSLPLAMVDPLFDRYFLFYLTPVMILIVSGRHAQAAIGRAASITGMVLLGAYTMFAVGATHDFLALNTARWKALHDLTEVHGIPYTQIDGGYEFNGWYGYDDFHDNLFSTSRKKIKSWWWVTDDKYIIACGPIFGYQEMSRYPYPRWIPLGEGNIFVLGRTGNDRQSKNGLD